MAGRKPVVGEVSDDDPPLDAPAFQRDVALSFEPPANRAATGAADGRGRQRPEPRRRGARPRGRRCLIKFLPHGKGWARAAVDYLVGEGDAEGRRRERVEVLRGTPDVVADSLALERR